MGMFDHVKSEWGVMKGAPLAFVGLVIIGLGGGFTAGMMFMGQQVANAESYARLKVEEVERFKVEAEALRTQLAERPAVVGEEKQVLPDFEFPIRDPNAPIQTGKDGAPNSDTFETMPYKGPANSNQNAKPEFLPTMPELE